MMHKQFTGLTVLILGALALVQSMGIAYLGLSFWPALLVWLGLEMVWGSAFSRWHGPSLFGAALGVLVAGTGVVQILANAGIMAASLSNLFWPLLLIALGLSILFGRRHVHWC